jgi:rsbT co-antagonist protein RsbR
MNDTNSAHEQISALQDRIAELEQALQHEREHNRIFKALAENAPDVVTVGSLEGILTYVNPTYKALTGYGDDLLGMNIADLHAEGAAGVQPIVEGIFSHGSWQGIWHFRHKDGHRFPAQLSAFLIYNAEGQPVALGAIIRDVTEQERLREEQAARERQQQIIETQRSALRELSTPLIPITDEVTIMPLIGTIDSKRAQQILETLLEGVAHYQAKLVILDITGVMMVDTQVAQALVQAAQAVKLLGAQVMLTGIQPQIAQTLVHLGVDLSGILTQSSLQAGIAAALR